MQQELKIVLLGKTGVGKSATGNTILGEMKFFSARSMNSVTKKCQVEHVQINETKVYVIDTPGFFETNKNPSVTAKKIAKSVYKSAPGVHAFLFIVEFGRFTEHDAKIISKIEKVFRKKVTKHIIILFTHVDATIQDMDSQILQNKSLNTIVNKCGRRYHAFDNNNQANREQVTGLLEKIKNMVDQNNGKYYTNETFLEATRLRFREWWRRYRPYFLWASHRFRGTDDDQTERVELLNHDEATESAEENSSEEGNDSGNYIQGGVASGTAESSRIAMGGNLSNLRHRSPQDTL